MIGRFETCKAPAAARVDAFIDRWYIAGWDNGALWVQPRRQVLLLTEFCALLKRIQRLFRNRLFNAAVFHFDHVDVHPDHWAFVLRVLREFAKTTSARCRVVEYDARDRAHHRRETGENACFPGPHASPRPPIRLRGISVVIE